MTTFCVSPTRTRIFAGDLCTHLRARTRARNHAHKHTAKLECFEKIIGLERTIVFTVVRGAQEVDAAALLVRNSPSFLVVTFDSEYYCVVVVTLLDGCRGSLYTVKA